MGCHLPQNKTIIKGKMLNNKVPIIEEEESLNQYYEHLYFGSRIDIQSSYIFNIYDKRYILLASCGQERYIYDIQQNLLIEQEISYAVDLISVFTHQKFLFLLTEEYLFQLVQIDMNFLLKKRYLKSQQSLILSFINEQTDLYLDIQNQQPNLYLDGQNCTKLRSLRLQKQIIKLSQNNTTYNKNKFMIISTEEIPNSQQFINLINIQNRQIVMRQILSGFGPKQRIQKIIIVQNTDDILIDIQDLGLFIYKINYENKKVQKIKLLCCNVQNICIFDDKNQLNLITQLYYIQFDRQYNIVRKYKIDYAHNLFAEGYKLLECLNDVKIINNLPELYCFWQISQQQTYELYKLKNNYHKKQVDKTFQKDQINYNYQYQQLCGRKQHLLSNNQKYLAFIICKSLIFHNILNKSERQLCFNNNIRFLNFSGNSNQLYVLLYDIIYCYQTQQNLKKCYELHFEAINIQTNSVNFIIAKKIFGQLFFYSKQSKKLIFKLTTIQRQILYQYHLVNKNTFQYDYQPQNGIILAYNEDKVTLFSLADRKLLSTITVQNKQCKLIPNCRDILILTRQEQLQIWSYNDDPIQKKKIMNNVSTILQGYQEFYCLYTKNWIIVLDKSFQITDQIYYKETRQREEDSSFNSKVVNQEDQIIQRNLIIRATVYKIMEEEQIIILSLEKREKKSKLSIKNI